MQVLLDPEEHVVFPNASTHIFMVSPVACRERVGEILTDARYTNAGNRKEQQQPVDLTQGGSAGNQNHEPWRSNLCFDIWAVLKGLPL